MCSEGETSYHTYGEAAKKPSADLHWGWGNANPATADLSEFNQWGN